MRTGELDCIHGVGHSAGIHGCDGCCIKLLLPAQVEAWEEGYAKGAADATTDGWLDGENPYQIKLSANDYNQLRKAIEE